MRAMKLEDKYRLIEKLIQTEDEELLLQVEEILGSSPLSQEQMEELDRRKARYERGETKLYSWEEVKEIVRKRA